MPYSTDNAIKKLSEVFPNWSLKDLENCLLEANGDLELALTRLTEGQTMFWTTSNFDSRKKRKPFEKKGKSKSGRRTDNKIKRSGNILCDSPVLIEPEYTPAKHVVLTLPNKIVFRKNSDCSPSPKYKDVVELPAIINCRKPRGDLKNVTDEFKNYSIGYRTELSESDFNHCPPGFI